MKKYCFVFAVVLGFNAYGEIITGDKCGDNCTWTFDTETGKLTVSGTGEMYDYGGFDTHQKLWEGSRSTYQTFAPWGEYSSNIQKIDITDGITYIGGNTFYNTTVSEIHIPDSVTYIGGGAFQFAKNLTQIDLPKNLQTIGHATFCNTSIENFIIPEGVSFIVHPSAGSRALASENLQSLIFDSDDAFIKDMIKDAQGILSSASIFCKSSNIGCSELKTDQDIGSSIQTYDKQDGVYILNGQMYASSNDMMNNENACSDLDSCKIQVLKNKDLCSTNESCMDLINSAKNGKMLKLGSKTYQSLDALLKGNYDKRRIYTIEEANQVAGDKNRVSITYR
ncbi:MAG: leucine-rich repeat domain-containing protein [Alphaproteobacteria bacterium]|nr:leucine-rich repeat domain-containing protein [Alphaproteobacteria bacterium]